MVGGVCGHPSDRVGGRDVDRSRSVSVSVSEPNVCFEQPNVCLKNQMCV